MPKKSKSSKKKNNSFHCLEGITLNDYANSSTGNRRIKKGSCSTQSLVKTGKESILIAADDDDCDWFNKDWDNFHIDIKGKKDEDQSETDDSNLTKVPPGSRRKKMSSCVSDTADLAEGNIYPMDIWYILGRYIHPEDIGRFSLICRSSYAVTLSTRFWTKLYNRYYSDLVVLPVRLRPDSMERLYELRACVIKALYHMYPLFNKRIKSVQISDPHAVLKRTCVMFWHQKGNGLFHYYFKMQENMGNNYNQISLKELNDEDRMEALGDIHANSQSGFKVLQLTSTTFSIIPPTIFGQTLLAVSSTLSSDLRAHNLKLIFGPSHAIHYTKKGITPTNIPEGSYGVSLNSVVLVQVLDWWNPLYPNVSTEVNSENNFAVADKFF